MTPRTPTTPTSDVVFADLHSLLSTEYQESELTRCESRSSSLKPCYTPSRPSSYLFQPDLLPSGTELGCGTESYSYTEAPNNQSVGDGADSRSILAPSTYTNQSRYTVHLVRHPPFVISDHNNNGAKEETPSISDTPPVNWPSVARLRKSVTSVLQLRRKKSSKSEAPVLGGKSSIIQRAFSSHVADDAYSKKLRRVRSSFARFVTLDAVDGATYHGDADVVEDAKGIMEKTRMRWKFEEMSQEHGGGDDIR